MRKILFLDSLVIDLTPTFAFFSFKSKEAVTWGLHLIKKFLRIVQSFDNSIVFFNVFFPLLVPNILTSSGQSVNNFCVVKGECDYSNFDGSLVSLVAINT